MTVTITATSAETKLLVVDETGDRLIARLPSLATAHRWALRALLESMALWAERPVRVVLYADETYEWERCCLLDGLGLGAESLHMDVQFVPLARSGARRRAKHLRNLGSFAQERRRLHRVGGQP
jgi:hypothetical protein